MVIGKKLQCEGQSKLDDDITASDNRELKQFISEISTSFYNWLEIEWCEKYFSSLKTTYLYNVQLLIKIKYLFRLQYHLETF